MKGPFGKNILFLRVKNQDKGAYGEFYDLYVARIYRFIFFKINSVHDAQDLTSEVFLKLWQSIREGKEIKNLNSFVYTIARNAVIDFYRNKSRENQSLDSEEAGEIAAEGNPAIQSGFDDRLAEIMKGLKFLKDEYREVIILRFLDDLSIKEIASVVNKSRGSVRILVYRALRALRNNIKLNE